MDDGRRPRAKPLTLKRLVPLLILAGGFAAFFALGLDRHLSFATLRENRDALNAWVQSYGLLAPAVYMLTYAAVIAFSLPGGAVMSIAGGFLFGWVWATACIVVAATVGATAVFIIAKTSLGDPLRAKAGPWMKKMEAGFRENALSYLLVLRLVPLFPFWLVNLVPAFLGVPLRTYVIGTFFGIIPGTFVYASVGASLRKVVEAGGEFTVKEILSPQIIVALVGLAALAMTPVVYRKIKGRRAVGASERPLAAKER